jgi:hypothetical protein
LRAIKRLQEERFLPLAVIKSLLDAGDGERWLEPQAFPHLDMMLRARLGDEGRVAAAQVAAQTGHSAEEIAEAQELGFVAVGADGAMSSRDAAIMRALGDLKAIGFTRDRGFDGAGLKIYAEFVDWLVAQEVRMFFEHTAGQVDEAEAVLMAERGVSAVNELLTLLRTREILRRLEARRRVANDNG